MDYVGIDLHKKESQICILIYEKNRGQLLREVQNFLEEADSPDPRRGAPER